MDKKEKVLLAAILMALCHIEAILTGAECKKCGEHCGKGKKAGRAARDPRETEQERLPDVPDWRDTEAAKRRDAAAQFDEDDKLTQIRLIVASHQGEKLSKIIEAIKAGAGISNSGLAALLGVHPARITEAVRGKARPGFVQIFTEILGEGADLAAKKSGKRGAK